MLVLSRRKDEAICIGDNIRISVVSIQGGRVKLSVEAPPGISIDREEIYHAKRSLLRNPASAQSVDVSAVENVLPVCS